MTEGEKKVREYLADIGRRGGLASRRELTRSHAKQMVAILAISEAKRAAQNAGKPWPPRDTICLASLDCGKVVFISLMPKVQVPPKTLFSPR